MAATPSLLTLARDALRLGAGHTYGDLRENRADLYVPPGDGPHPVAVTIHGGYWQATYGKWTMRLVAADLVRRGWAVWNIEYRRLGRGEGGGWPATFDDVAGAIDHLDELADPRLDLSAVTAIGHSAGGQLALWAASRTAARVPVRRVLAQAPVTDMVAAGAPARELLGGGVEQVPDRYAAADPIRLVPLPVPVLVVHGADDATVPVERSREWVAAARSAGGDAELVEPVPGGHRAHVDTRTPAWRAGADWVTGPARHTATP